jgi:biotin carboxylase
MPGADADRPLLLVIRTGLAEVREYILKSISTQYRIHLILGAEPDWELAYIDGWTRLENNRDPAVLIAAARAVDRRTPISGVFTWDESRIAQAAEVAAALGLPGPTPDVIARCRDKRLTRQALDAAGVPQPRSIRVDTVSDALDAAHRLGYPVVLKPSDLAFSMGVVVAADSDELRRHFPFTRDVQGGLPGYRATVLVEEFVPGTEISVDAVVWRGEVSPLVLARKQLGYPPYCIEVGHYVDASDPLLTDEAVGRVLRDAHAALGFVEGVTHTEIKLSPTGPKIIEVNGRLGGGLIPYLGLRATGIDAALAAAAVACGRAPRVAADRALVAGVRFCYVDADDTVISSIGFDRALLPDAVDRTVIAASPGDVKSPPPKGTSNGRIGFATVVTATAAQCRGAMAAVAAALRVVPHPTAEVAAEAPAPSCPKTASQRRPGDAGLVAWSSTSNAATGP